MGKASLWNKEVFMWEASDKDSKMGMETFKEPKILRVSGSTTNLSSMSPKIRFKNKDQKKLREKDRLRKIGKIDFLSFFSFDLATLR